MSYNLKAFDYPTFFASYDTDKKTFFSESKNETFLEKKTREKWLNFITSIFQRLKMRFKNEQDHLFLNLNYAVSWSREDQFNILNELVQTTLRVAIKVHLNPLNIVQMNNFIKTFKKHITDPEDLNGNRVILQNRDVPRKFVIKILSTDIHHLKKLLPFLEKISLIEDSSIEVPPFTLQDDFNFSQESP